MCDALTFRNTFLSTDIICVKFHGPFVLAGIGGILKVFSLSSYECISEVEVFKGHKIYGLQSGPNNKILIFGSKSVKVLRFTYSHDDVCISCVSSLLLEDWILAAHWLCLGTEIALVTAHNVVWLWKWVKNEPLKRAVCHEKCILYSATVCGEDWTNSVVFAGTVFKEVVVWLPGTEEEEADKPVIHRLEGHNGVIFSLVWDWPSYSLCSTSDDRSVRLWKFSLSSKHDWKSSQLVSSQVLFGHSARVWGSIIYQDFVVSVGEDCQICVWRAGRLLQSFERASSGCQWNLDFSKEYQLLVIGAGDGSVQLLPLMLLQNALNAEPVLFHQTLKNQLISSCVRKLILLKNGRIVIITDDGKILSGYPNIESSWQIVYRDERLANYCVLSVSPDRTKFSLASLKGFVMIFQSKFSDNLKLILEKEVEVGKIWSLQWLSGHEILVCGDEGRLSVWQMNQISGGDLICVGRFRLPKARERWPTCARLFTRNDQSFILCGDRCGSLHLFCMRDDKPVALDYLAPNQSLSKLHSKLGVTSLLVEGNKIFSTGRDGTLRSLGIDSGSNHLSVLSTDRLIMDWVCLILPVPSRSNLVLIVGFKETNLIVWSMQERRTILHFDCGGGHRSWDCVISDRGDIEIAFVREKITYYLSRSCDVLMKPTLLHGISARELNCVAVLSDEPSVFLFGGEDGTIYMCKFSKHLESLESKLSRTSHISSVRCVSLYGSLLFSAGGRAQLKAWKIGKHSHGELSCIELASFMLKGERRAQLPPSVDPEMRFMTLCCVSASNDQTTIQLVSGCSDGAMRWLSFDSIRREFKVVGESMFHHKCVLKLLCVSLLPDKKILLSTATDGTVALWDITLETFSQCGEARAPFWSNRFHQSGVNSIHAQVLPDENSSLLLLGTGGDDNSVTLSVLHLENRNVSIVANWSSNNAHAAQITGVWLFGKWLLSSSIDQRLTVWHWEWSDSSHLKCDFVHQTICSVPDIQDMQVHQERDLLYVSVVGKGVQIFSVAFPPTVL